MTVHSFARSKLPRQNMMNDVRLFSRVLVLGNSMRIDKRQSIQLCPPHTGLQEHSKAAHCSHIYSALKYLCFKNLPPYTITIISNIKEMIPHIYHLINYQVWLYPRRYKTCEWQVPLYDPINGQCLSASVVGVSHKEAL